MSRIAFSSLLVFFALMAPAQNTTAWTLQMCIDYALKNNLNVKQQQLNADLSKATLLQSKAQILPSANGNAGRDYNFGRVFDVATGQLSSNQTYTENFNLSGSVTLFNGLQNYNRIKQNQYNLQSGQGDVEKIKNDVSLNVASAYLQILFNEEILENAKRQYDITLQQTERIKKMVEIGSRAKGDLLDMEAQLANDELTITNTQNNLDISYLTLVQLLDLDSAANFKIDKPQLPEPGETILNISPSSIYAGAVKSQPEIKSAEFLQKSNEKALAVARGAISPRLSLNGNYGTRFSQLIKEPADPLNPFGDLVIVPYWDQIDENTYKSVSISLFVPIFNNLQTHTNITRSKINLLNSKYNLEITQNQLRKNIEQAYADASGAYKNYKSTQRSVEAMEEAFKYAEEKFNVGAISSVDLNDTKNRLNRAKSDLLQAKYNYIFKSKVLDFYMGKPLVF